MRAVHAIGAILLLGVAGCQKPETPAQVAARMGQESAAAKTQVAALARRWESWTDAGQADSFAAVFTDQGLELPPHAPAAVGPAAIQANHARQASMGQWKLQITVDDATANGPLAVARGTYVNDFTPGPNAPPGIPAADTGKWVGQYQQAAGTWKTVALIWNSDLPQAMPPATASPAKKPAATPKARH
jgi:ketosteroid isomerase-like protein